MTPWTSDHLQWTVIPRSLSLMHTQLGRREAEEPELLGLPGPPSPTLEFEKHRATPGLSRRPQWSRTCLPVQQMEETKVRSPGQEDSLEEGTATHSSILAWRILRAEEPVSPSYSPQGHQDPDMTEVT